MVKTNLFFNYYEDKDRQKEIDYCLEKNKLAFDNVIIVKGRPTFNELFALTKDYPNDINIFCNSDICFLNIDLLPLIEANECWALTRYEPTGFYNRADSQDAWIFRGVVKNIDANFTMGKWGCDNRLAFEIQKAGYKISNPSLSIKTMHLHAVDNRNHKRTPENTIPPPYLTLKPTSL